MMLSGDRLGEKAQKGRQNFEDNNFPWVEVFGMKIVVSIDAVPNIINSG
jgi:hypothetical protein